MACTIDVFFKGSEGSSGYDYTKDRKVFGIIVNGDYINNIVMRPDQQMSDALSEFILISLINPTAYSGGALPLGNFRDTYSNEYKDRSCFYFTV